MPVGLGYCTANTARDKRDAMTAVIIHNTLPSEKPGANDPERGTISVGRTGDRVACWEGVRAVVERRDLLRPPTSPILWTRGQIFRVSESHCLEYAPGRIQYVVSAREHGQYVGCQRTLMGIMLRW